ISTSTSVTATAPREENPTPSLRYRPAPNPNYHSDSIPARALKKFRDEGTDLRLNELSALQAGLPITVANSPARTIGLRYYRDDSIVSAGTLQRRDPNVGPEQAAPPAGAQGIFEKGRLEAADELVHPEFVNHEAPPGCP